MQYFDEAAKIWKNSVPKSGQSNTVEGELLRAVEKFRDQAIRNGNSNWDDGFEILLHYLRDHLADPAVFAPETIEETMTVLRQLGKPDQPILEDEPYDYLCDQVVIVLRHYGSRPRQHNPDLHR